MLTAEDGWLAGIIEGEGTVDVQRRSDGRSARLRVRVKMVDEDVVARVAALWGASYRRRGNGRWRDQYETEVSGRRAEELCARLLPLFGERRSAKLEECLGQVSRKRERALSHEMGL